jgi:uncharacterized protein DUF3800
MTRVHVFADESGNFDFSQSRGATRYFILTAITLKECSRINADLQDLRHQMAWEGIDHPGPFHASHDPGRVRDRVFRLLDSHDFHVDALVLEKAKAQPKIRSSQELFYQYAWYYLMKYVTPRIFTRELLVVSASVGSRKKKRLAFYNGVQDVLRQVGRVTFRTACWDAGSDACLQVADYCGWAIQRKWESGDTGAYERIAPKVRSEFDLWARGKTLYY